ncbi:MAG: M15 family metallopeptidase [Clostridiales bacterium]|nr:M15 family metallopeptidase [Clostridiales bacterium]
MSENTFHTTPANPGEDNNKAASNHLSNGQAPRQAPVWKALCRQAAKPFSFLLLLIMICAFLARYLTGSETLAEYAANNPEQAYGSQDNTGDASTEYTNSNDADNSSNAEGAASSDADGTGNGLSAYDEAETTDGALQSVKENETMNDHSERITYQPGFYYEPLNETLKQRITGISYPVSEALASETAVMAVNIIADDTTPAISYDDLRYVSVLHYDFDGKEQEGELICHQAIAQDMVEIFYELYQNDYQIEKIRLIDEYSGDDTLSMMDNNTSCFNYRVVDGTSSLSKHAYGLAIDINPFYNPYIVFGKGENGGDYISPAGSEIYADRSKSFAYKIDETDLCYRLFKEHGFTWGGDWNSCKDYQHFQKTLE